ncbi:head GIN domain-containing protein [Urechidicola croceus]|uniref:Putative auto-transporter adhesin head GIN domain-containing protein n=1 Tax=Urechidicola croceus TaxID=1850246 RepID=A0A1D8PB92_9FLAO|nr:head GIN domain-containing protein [Urechidicola croceus]AOW21833.1 hypothetical protein LPB138_14580 [Urechidicola croceus]
MKKATTKFAILLLVLFTTTSCFFDGFGIQGNRNVVSEDRKITSDFNEIKVSQGIQVFLTQGNDTDISVEADENIIDLLITEVDGDVLKIYFEKNVSRAKARNVYLTANKLNRIKTSSGSHVKGEGTFKSKSMNLDSSSGSGININVDAGEIICSTSSGANMTVKGSTNTFNGNASSGSHINAGNLISNIGDADVSSGAGIKIHVNEELTAHASSGGNISYNGNPEKVNRSKSSGGSISKH